MRQATCAPIETIVNVVPQDERDPTIFYFPSCIKIQQCGGCCSHTGTTCSPTDEVEKQVTVKKTKFTGGQRLQALGDITVKVKEHKKCKCQCKKTASDCNSLQKFIGNQCRCECLNIEDAENCAKVRTEILRVRFRPFMLKTNLQDSLKLWDTKSCACVCRDSKECATGLQFDQGSCSCQPVRS